MMWYMIDYLKVSCQGHIASSIDPPPYSMQMQSISRYLILNYAENILLVLSYTEKLMMFGIKWLVLSYIGRLK